MKICQILKINLSLGQQPTGDRIHILIGLDALNLLGYPIYFAHLSSSSLPADLNSKKIDKPLDVANSEMWRRGPPEYFELGPPTNWFMENSSSRSKDLDRISFL